MLTVYSVLTQAQCNDRRTTSACEPGASKRAGLARLVILGAIMTALGLGSALDAWGATYYVATNGADTNPGSQAQPWRTIQKAASTAQAGDTVNIAGGTYKEKVTFPASGTAAAPIIFQNVAGQTPVIDGSGVSVGTYGALVLIKDVHHLTLNGLTIANSGYWNLYVGGDAHHIQLNGLEVRNAATSNIFIDGPKTTPGFSSITNSKIHGAKQGGITLWSAPAGYWKIENNEVYGNIGEGNYDGIQIGGGVDPTSVPVVAHHIVVRGNVVHDNASSGDGTDNLDLGGHAVNHHYLVEQNHVYGSHGSFKLHSGSLRDGFYTPGVSSFHIARFNRIEGGYVTYGFPNPIAVYNNTIVNGDQTFMIYNEDSSLNKNVGDSTYTGGDAGRMNWKNNLFWQEAASTAYALLTAGAGSIDLTYRSVRFQNNLYKFASGQKIAWLDIFGPPITSAVFANYQSSNAPNLPDVGSLLTTATTGETFANFAAQDYRLVAGSPAIDRGTPLTKATNAGSNSTIVQVDRASYFQDGYCINGECLSTPDSIVIGSNAPVAIVSINDANNEIRLATPLTWQAGASVTLPYNGTAPDMGAYEYGGTTTVPQPPQPPSDLHILSAN